MTMAKMIFDNVSLLENYQKKRKDFQLEPVELDRLLFYFLSQYQP